MNEQKFQLGIKALIMQDNKILLLKVDTSKFSDKNRNLYYWDIPGGRIQKGQTIEETLLREIEEEVGTKDIIVEKHFDSLVSNIKIPPDNDGLILFTFICKFKDKNQKIVLNEESVEYKWATVQETQELLTHKYTKSFIEKLNELK